MCGVLFEMDDELCNENKFKYALDSQSHRGPDGSKYKVLNSGKILIGNNRLAIVDKVGGTQPFASPDSKVFITFNGEIFNSQYLRDSLEKRGVIFQSTHSDTEVILQMYLNFGINFLDQINGMFAIIIVDLNLKHAYIIRDRFGIKPIYYKIEGTRKFFASDLRAIKILSRKNEISTHSVMEFVGMGFISNPDTIYQDITSLQPASYMDIDLESGKSHINMWWTPPLGEYEDISFEESVILVRHGLIDAVTRWTTSDYPIALSLSGGIDSSSIFIACLEANIEVAPFFMGFKDENLLRWDESKIVSSFAEKFGISYKYVEMSAQDLAQNLSTIVNHLEQPYGGGVPSWKIFSSMKLSGYRVALSGTGGDELFGNYNRGMFLPENVFKNLQSFKSNYLNKSYKIYPFALSELFSKNLEELFVDKLFYKAHKYSTLDLQKRSALFDIETQLTDEFLMMTDKLSMMSSIEARTPFLDHIFFEQVHKIPNHIKNVNGSYKLILKNAFGDVMPEFLKTAPKKGFSLPLSIWFRGELREFLTLNILDDKFINFFNLNKKIIVQTLNSFFSGENSQILFIWRILMLSMWFNSVHAA